MNKKSKSKLLIILENKKTNSIASIKDLTDQNIDLSVEKNVNKEVAKDKKEEKNKLEKLKSYLKKLKI
ncbi:MAG: hypothetical protein JNJ56_09300 [Ignavibacteria bacterium]|nr:hypothetical protein [Ignavibacteria bacterium]